MTSLLDPAAARVQTIRAPLASGAVVRAGRLARLVVGVGDPVTVLAHGLVGGSADTRPLGTALAGTCVHADLRGHGDSPDLPPQGWDYPMLAADLLALADEVGASRGIGMSLGADALLHLMAERPDRFERVVLLLPAGLDQPRSGAGTARLKALGAAIDAGNTAAVAALLQADLPPALRGLRLASIASHRRAAALVRRPAPRPASDDVRPVADRAVLGVVRCPVLVVAQHDDPLHPVAVGREVAAALPQARLEVLPPGSIPGIDMRPVAELIADFLDR